MAPLIKVACSLSTKVAPLKRSAPIKIIPSYFYLATKSLCLNLSQNKKSKERYIFADSKAIAETTQLKTPLKL
jgi:hypothetical protein